MTGHARAAAAGVLAFALVGCGGPSMDPAFSPSVLVGEVPQFVGPWAVELTDLYSGSKSDLEREVLADETITEEEYQALEDWYVGCMAGQGITVVVEELGYDLGDGDQDTILAAERACKTDTLSVALDIRGNPDNVPVDVATHGCMVRHGDVAPDFTLEDYHREMEARPVSDAWMALMFSDEGMACNSDPFDLLGMYPSE
ncbi:MAG TPA: hypothetical protein VGC57_16655 [Cellulomonas sp.]